MIVTANPKPSSLFEDGPFTWRPGSVVSSSSSGLNTWVLRGDSAASGIPDRSPLEPEGHRSIAHPRPSASRTPLVAGSQLGSYRLLKLLGRGARGRMEGARMRPFPGFRGDQGPETVPGVSAEPPGPVPSRGRTRPPTRGTVPLEDVRDQLDRRLSFHGHAIRGRDQLARSHRGPARPRVRRAERGDPSPRSAPAIRSISGP